MEVLIRMISVFLKCCVLLMYCLTVPFGKLFHYFDKKHYCSPINNEILLQSATKITQRIRRREISCEEVVNAYVARCKEVNPLINAIVEDRFETAIQEAREADDFLRSTTMDDANIASEKPLLGLPITIKESIAVEGMSHCVGVKDAPARATRDADVVARIRQAGGIPLLVSNTPELCFWYHTFNKVTGVTKNPYDTRRSSGGSSGGEAALLGSGASILGLGSDIGGSIRFPAMLCGVFGHKPTPDYISVEGHKPNAADENWSSFFSIGPIVRYAMDLPLLLSVISQSSEARICFNRKVSLKDIKFFYMDEIKSIGMGRVNEDTKGAIHKLRKHLKDVHGIEVPKADLKAMKLALEISVIILLRIKGVYSTFNRLDDPKKSKNVFMEMLKYICFMSSHTFPVIFYAISNSCFERFPRSVYDAMIEKRAQLKKQFEELLGDNGVLIFPTCGIAEYYGYENIYILSKLVYTAIFNALGFPVTQCPLGYNRNQSPIGLQIVANPGCDHLTIAVAQEIERTFGGWQEPAIVSVGNVV